MGIARDLPSYEELFGDLDFKKGEEARSVYSPAAYLTDLLQLLDDYFEPSSGEADEAGDPASLIFRRPDIADIVLDGANTFDQIPYLDIVNALLQRLIEARNPGRDALALLKTTPYPLNLPLNFDFERLKKFLGFLKVTPAEIEDLFSREIDLDRRARNFLGLSPEEAAYLLANRARDEAALKTAFNLGEGERLTAAPEDVRSGTVRGTALAEVSRFLLATGLSGLALRELLAQQLSATAVDGRGRPETGQAGRFFINYRLGGYATLDPTEDFIIWQAGRPASDEESPAPEIPLAWFDRVDRFIRLAQKSGFSFTDLDLVLRSCCDNRLDAAALPVLAMIDQLRRRHDLPVDVICALFSQLNTLGLGDEKAPADLFNRTFNQRFATLEGRVISPSTFTHPAYRTPGGTASLPALAQENDILSEGGRPLRRRLQKTLRLSERDLILIVETFRAKAQQAPAYTSSLARELTLPGFSLLFRVATLTELLDITVSELFGLLDLIDNDSLIRATHPFAVPLPVAVREPNSYRILERAEDTAVTDALWLVQLLAALVSWSQASDLSVTDLSFIQRGAYATPAETEQARQQAAQRFARVVDAFLLHAFQPASLVSDTFDARSARVLHEALLTARPPVVAPHDPRIVAAQPDVSLPSAYAALQRLAQVTAADFQGLGLADRLNDKLYQNLIIHGYLNTEGEIQAAHLPNNAAAFVPVHDFTDRRAALFDRLHTLYRAELDDQLARHDAAQGSELADLEVFLYVSDLADLALTPEQTQELYDNLILNGVIDDEGRVATPAHFADFELEAALAVNTILTPGHTRQVFELLKRQVAAYHDSAHTLQRTIFDSLALPDFELEELLENLQFNDYIDPELAYINKQDLLQLNVNDFKLALKFYPRRHKILAALQADLAADRRRYLTLTKEQLLPVADTITAAICFARIADRYLTETGQIAGNWRSFFGDAANSAGFQLGTYFTPELDATIFGRLRTIQTVSDRYRVTKQALLDLKLAADEVDELLFKLARADFIDESGALMAARHDYFLNVNNALVFGVAGFEDFNTDIFFALNAVARAIDEAREEINTVLSNLAANQENAVIDTLAEGLEIEGNSLKTLCDHLLYQPDQRVAALLKPILPAAGTVAQGPPQSFSRLFQRLAQFVRLVNILKLDADDIAVVFQDQNLVEKFPELLDLPPGVTRFDALLSGVDDKIYLFNEGHYWRYNAATYELDASQQPLATLSPHLAGLPHIDAAFVDPSGSAWLISGANYFRRQAGATEWLPVERSWGQLDTNFRDPQRIDASYTTREGVTYLFAGDQYARYSGGQTDFVDPGYPKKIRANWSTELESSALPERFTRAIDAAFATPAGEVFLFKDDKFVRIEGEQPATETDIVPFWGQVRNNFAELTGLDAAFSDGGYVYLFLEDQVTRYANHVDNDGVFMDDGFPLRLTSWLPDLPDDFEFSLDAAFKGADGRLHLFKNNRTACYSADLKRREHAGELTAKWGIVKNNIQTRGTVDAAFTGLDGCCYLFSGDQYVRYSGRDFSRVDEGFPRTIARDWGGLTEIGAAFILAGKTYLFAKSGGQYVCYSTNDYTVPDEGFPKVLDQEAWWNLPQSLVQAGFSEPDEIFDSQDGWTYLFKADRFVAFDHVQRWWSEPADIASKWNGLEFKRIDAAFTGKDGRTYLFSGQQFARYSDPDFNQLDDRYPRAIAPYWGQVFNEITRNRRIDSALVVDSRETIIADESGAETTVAVKHTYLFSGSHYFRYSGDAYEFVDEGYPRTIRTALATEPRFSHLSAPLNGVIDAAFADQRQVYLVQGDTLHSIADTAYRRYDDRLEQSVSAAVLDEGALYLAGEAGWQRHNHLEMATARVKAELPPLLRPVPAEFQSGLSAILTGVDENSYLFKGEYCYNMQLDRAYPTREEWGIVRNLITQQNHIDAAFVGTDGQTYLFCGDQFVVYPPGVTARIDQQPVYITGFPRPIAEHWGGLTHVHLAFVRAGKTYLMEKPDEFGVFRYVCYSNSDYTKVDSGGPQTANMDFWEIPHIYREDGFERIDAVLNDAHNLFLIQGQEFLQYNYATDVWTYAKPVDRVWRGLDFEATNFRTIATAFQAGDGRVFFFSEDSFVAVEHDFDRPVPAAGLRPIHPIRAHWGLVHNSFTERGTVDAAFVWAGRETYLFSGAQYIRYSTPDYRFVDDGYPKAIATDLRQEAIFRNLPPAFDTELQALAGQEQGVTAVVAGAGTIYLFVGQTVHAVSVETDRSRPLGGLGHLKNRIVQRQKIDAALVNGAGQVLLLADDQLFKYSDSAFEFVDEGYPQPLGDWLLAEGGFAQLPPHFGYALDAVTRLAGEAPLVLFKGPHYLTSADPATVREIRGDWGRVRNNFVALAGQTNMALDAVFVGVDGRTYLFKGDQYLRYTDFDSDFADEGFPRPIKDNWGQLPARFENGISGGFVFEGKTYLLHDDDSAEYVRYSRPDYHRVDNIYPQPLADRWRTRGDYLLGDLRLISVFQQLQEQTGGLGDVLSASLSGRHGDTATPYEMLNELFGWDVLEVKWIKRHNAFLAAADRFENRFNLETIEKMDRMFTTAGKMGVGPSAVYGDIWRNLFDPARPADFAAAANALYGYLGSKSSERDWDILKQQIHDELNLLKRDVWLPLVLAQNPHLTRPKELFERLLIDVEMGSAARTSKVKEAISAIQLYFHRYLVNLEAVQLARNNGTGMTRDQFKERWQWLKNYRLWEANRKVFLYPENYIRPELRDTKTPEFKSLEDVLLQGELNLDTAENAFNTYLDDFSQVSNLKITGANVYEADGDKVLLLFGHTRLEPRQFYYRTAHFTPSDDPDKDDLTVWQAWEKVDVTIKADRVFPIRSNGRLMVFWIEIEDIEEPEAKFKSKAGQQAETVSEVNIAQKKLRQEANIKFSLLKFDKHWTPPQQIKNRVKLDYEIDAAYSEGDQIVTFAGGYCLKSTDENPEGEIKRIEEYDEFKSLPPSFREGIEAATTFKDRRYLFKGGQCVIQETGTSGRILAHTSLRDLIVMPKTKPLLIVAPGVFWVNYVIEATTEQATKNMILDKGVDAAFELGSGIMVLVDKEGNYSFYTESGGKLHPIQDQQTMVGLYVFFPIIISTLVNRSGNFRPADAVFKKDDIFYVLRDGQYECYDDVGNELVPLDGFPKPIRGNLSFNMDKFFNNLHLEPTADQINVSYMSPKGNLLLYGKLKSDFTFQEIPIQQDRALTMALSWNSVLYNNIYDYYAYWSDEMISESNQFVSTLNKIRARIDNEETVRQAVSSLDEALSLAKPLVDASDENEESRGNLPKQAEQLTVLLGRVKDQLTPLRNQTVYKSAIQETLAYINRALEVIGQLDDNRRRRERLRGQSRELIEAGSRARDQLNEANRVEGQAIKEEIAAVTQAIAKFNSDPLQPDHQYHADAARTFGNLLNTTTDYVNAMGPRINADIKDELQLINTARTGALNTFIEINDRIPQLVDDALTVLQEVTSRTQLATDGRRLETAATRFGEVAGDVAARTAQLKQINTDKQQILTSVSYLVKSVKEALLGTFDLFPSAFGIPNTTNFAFSEPDRPDWYVFESLDGTFLCRPLSDALQPRYEIVRLTSLVVPRLSSILFARGLKGFLSLQTQQEDEAPAFGRDPGQVHFNDKILQAPVTYNLDFYGATGIYYSELFFHAPFLIAQALNAAQKFEEARLWYEFIFDPTNVESPWQYLPFHTAGPESDFLIDRGQLKRYLDDPFDPHAIAALRPTAYRKAIVMSYIDNLLDWGDMLFRQYTIESINEARMLYTLAYDLLGDKPENLGTLVLSPPKRAIDLANTDEYDFVIEPAGVDLGNSLIGREPITIVPGTPHDSVGQRYFFVPENGVFMEYWNRVEDRLYKIRHSLNIDGQAQPLPLFEPPIDPMALVQAVARGVSLSQLLGGAAVQVPHYRFEFLVFRAQNLIQKLNQYGGELLATLEKKDAEALNLLQNRQEGDILSMTIATREAEIKEAEETILNLEESRRHAQERIQLYSQWLASGMLPEEMHQLNLMIAAAAAHFAGSALKTGAMIAGLIPDAMVGPFIMGVKTGGTNIGGALSAGAEVAESLGEGLSVTGEILGMQAQIKHMIEDWDVQLMIAKSEEKQIAHQLEGAKLQKMVAQYELATLQKQIEQNRVIQTFMTDKFTNQELYQWLIGKMSGLYYQTYQMAFDMARMAEKAFQFERGLAERDVAFIQGGYWDSQRKGLLAGEQLALDLDRMEQAFVESNERRLEITKEVSLLALDPMAFLRLKSNGTCEFALDEAFYDYDFPGHYCRQIKTVALEFDVPEGVTVNATLTQLSHQTVLQPDPKAVKFLLAPNDQPPTTIRNDWRPNQQIILSHHDQYEKNNGMFELRYDTDRYLPFEGTGAVSRWQLALNGKKGSVDLRELVDVTVHIKYTARPAGAVFADAVKGLLKPYQTVRFFDMVYDFPQAWNDFLDGDGTEFQLTFTRDQFPNMSSSKISGIFTAFDLAEAGRASLVLNGVADWTLNDRAYLDTSGLSIGRQGSVLRFTYRGDKQNLRNIQLVFSYRAAVA